MLRTRPMHALSRVPFAGVPSLVERADLERIHAGAVADGPPHERPWFAPAPVDSGSVPVARESRAGVSSARPGGRGVFRLPPLT